MPRPLRIEYPGARYHVMSRSDRPEDIYWDLSHRELFWGVAELERGRKGDPDKVEIARQLRAQTPTTRRSIAERLHMGSAGNLSDLLKI